MTAIKEYEVVRAFPGYRKGQIVCPIGMTRSSWLMRGLIKPVKHKPEPVVVPEPEPVREEPAEDVQMALAPEPVTASRRRGRPRRYD